MPNYTQPRDPTTGRYISANSGGSGGGGGFNLGNAHGAVLISTNVAEAMAEAKRSLQQGIQSLGASMQSLGSSMQATGGAITTLTAPLAIFGATGIKAAADFDSAMTAISARTGLTGDALEKVRQQALQLGADTMFSSQQAADAFLQLLTAGLSVEQAMATLPNVLTAAAAAGEDLGLTADLMTNVMSSFSLEANETARIVEAMSRAAASSPASMAEMGFALQDAGGIAKSYGLTLEDTAALFAIFAQNGIRGSEAATQLRSMMLNMTADTDKNEAAWAALGTSLYDAEGNMRNLDVVLGEIRTSLAGMTDEQRNDIIKTLAGSYGLLGFNALLASDGIDAMKGTMDSQSSATEVAATMMDTWNGAIDSLLGSIQTLQIEALTPFMNEVLKPMVQDLTQTVNGITEWVKANPELAQTLIKVGAALVVLGPVLVIAGTIISSLGTIVSALGAAFGLVTSPAFLLAAAIAAIIAAAQFGYPGGIAQLLSDAATSAQQLAFMGLWVLNLAAQNARFVLEQFRDVVIAVKDRIVEWTEKNLGLVLGFTALVIALNSAGVFTTIYNGVVTTMNTLLATSKTAALGLSTSMLAAIGPIIAVGVAIAGVIVQLKEFINLVGKAREEAKNTMVQKLMSGEETPQSIANTVVSASQSQAQDQSLGSQVLGFLGGLVGANVSGHIQTAGVSQGIGALGDAQNQIAAMNRDSGGRGIAGMPYIIGKGAQPEAFIPSQNGTFVPNIDKLGGDTYQIELNIAGANSYKEGYSAGLGALDAIDQRMQSKGLKRR